MADKRTFRRRDFVKLLGLVAAAAALPYVAGKVRQPVFWGNPFQLGVASGSPDATGFVLWTRLVSEQLTDDDVMVEWELFDASQPDKLVRQGQAVALAALAHSVHVELDGLKSNHWYQYRFRVAGYQSPMGRARTMPAEGQALSSLRLAYASCQRYEDGYYTAYRHMRGQQPDLVCFVGDYIYEYRSRAGAARPHTLRRIRNLSDYRDRYALYKSDPDLQAMHAACPWLIIWDDHEVENNYFGRRSTEGRGDISRLRAAAYQAFYEHMPLRANSLIAGIEGLLKNGSLQLYQTLTIGTLARLYLLDNRQYRAAPYCGESPSDGVAAVCAEAEPYRSMLGEAQEGWLEQAMLSGQAKQASWHLVVQQTRFTPANYHAGALRHMNRDSWDGYPQARTKLLQLFEQSRHDNLMVLGGDIHQNWVAKVHADPYNKESKVLATEFTGTSITSRSRATKAGIRRHLSRNPHLLYANAEYRGYGLVDITPAKTEVTLFAVEEVATSDSAVSVLARFAVPAGKPEQLMQLS
ncbi:alkaline phosphatase D family protein [Alkalimonas sp. MEB108]|uniref:Alkaline phosphatase D family protein n=1 Tax=Alkalimonas cellulosilytica TaxID=3058395 RepID=A0ABU7J6D3_9GAMM|nr:alkaline phosphatase D family protein [Alkalimonas sp. MEB108]MEE2001490.1 alkaline phosphatase D family protein [Alkalimonas sp. MEB108]